MKWSIGHAITMIAGAIPSMPQLGRAVEVTPRKLKHNWEQSKRNTLSQKGRRKRHKQHMSRSGRTSARIR